MYRNIRNNRINERKSGGLMTDPNCITIDKNTNSEWETPQYVYNYFNKIYNFNLDVCANNDNHKCNFYYDLKLDALKLPWYGNVWMNPPFKDLKQWIEKAYFESLTNTEYVVCLLPARTDTIAFHKFCIHGTVCLLK